MSRKTVEQFNEAVKEYGFELVSRRGFQDDKLYGYDLHFNGESVWLPDGYDMQQITQKDLNLKWKHNK